MAELFGGSPPINILLVGLDNSGKTTLLDQLVKDSSKSFPSTRRCHFLNKQRAGADVVATCNNRGIDVAVQQVTRVKVTPTIGFNTTQFSQGHQRVVVFDMSGQVSHK